MPPMTHLREKIETTPAKPELLINEPRVGYRLNIDLPAPQAKTEID